MHPDSSFRRVWEKHSTQRIAFEGGKLYLENFSICYTIHGRYGVPCQLYSLPPVRVGQKIEDCLAFEMPLEHIPRSRRGWRPCFLALTAHNWLYRYDGDSGDLLEEIYLSSKYRFRNISWDNHGDTIVLKSTHNKMAAFAQRTGIQQTLLMALAVFSVYPLRFIAMIEISREIFGHDISDALISHNTLLVMSHGGLIRFYSFQHVMEKGIQFEAHLHELCAATGTIVGKYPNGLPLNIKLTERPPVLFEVTCADHNIRLGGWPLQYIITPYGSRGHFHVYTLQDQQLVSGGTLDMGTLTIEPDKCYFHSDDSGRILHVGANEVRVLKILPHSGTNTLSKFSISEEFCINALKSSPDLAKKPVRYTSSGRAVRRSYIYDDDAVDLNFESIQSVDHEYDLDLLTVTSIQQDGDNYVGTVHFHDNQTGEFLQKFQMLESWREFCDHEVFLEWDTLVHVVTGPGRMFSCYVYQLQRTPDEKKKPPKRETAQEETNTNCFTRLNHRYSRRRVT